MRRSFIFLGLALCGFFAIWAYSISGKARSAMHELTSLDRQISKEREKIEMLRAEWAMLNRPERLRFLVENNFDQLQLMQISAKNYGETAQVPYSDVKTQSLEYIDPADIEAILKDLQTTDLGSTP